mgnify:CR=1 FL=1
MKKILLTGKNGQVAARADREIVRDRRPGNPPIGRLPDAAGGTDDVDGRGVVRQGLDVVKPPTRDGRAHGAERKPVERRRRLRTDEGGKERFLTNREAHEFTHSFARLGDGSGRLEFRWQFAGAGLVCSATVTLYT